MCRHVTAERPALRLTVVALLASLHAVPLLYTQPEAPASSKIPSQIYRGFRADGPGRSPLVNQSGRADKVECCYRGIDRAHVFQHGRCG